jgi:L-amino acid N-acyltransferase YncA
LGRRRSAARQLPAQLVDGGAGGEFGAAIFTENRAGIALHHAAGYRTVGIRERIAQRDGTWYDTVLIERRSPVN